MAKYKPGDKVTVRKDLTAYRKYYMEHARSGDTVMPKMLRLAGKEVTIEAVTPVGKYQIKEDDYNWTDEMFEPVKQSIVIYRRDRSVFALDKSTGKKAEAKCSPEDAFDFYTGAKIAFDRLTENDTTFKIGDILVALPNAPYGITTDGWVGKVVEIMSDDDITVRGLGLPGAYNQPLVNFTHLDSEYFRPAEDKDIPAGLLKKIWESEK
jgi:hypothetical protein